MASRFSITTEIARIFEKVYALRHRVWTIAVLRGMAGTTWFWLASLLLLGALNLF